MVTGNRPGYREVDGGGVDCGVEEILAWIDFSGSRVGIYDYLSCIHAFF